MKRYDKSQIMKNAWYLYLHSWNITFSEALKYAWRKAKKEAARKEREEKELEAANIQQAELPHVQERAVRA